jgi:hypothetical protein
MCLRLPLSRSAAIPVGALTFALVLLFSAKMTNLLPVLVALSVDVVIYQLRRPAKGLSPGAAEEPR